MSGLTDKIVMEGLTFDDVLLIPGKSSVLPKEANTSTTLAKGIKLGIPLVSAAMDTVTESNLAIALAEAGGLGFIHKNMTIAKQMDEVKKVKKTNDGGLLAGAAVGVGKDTIERVQSLVEAGVDIIAIDSAHGHSIGVLDMIKTIKEKYPDLPIVGGNVVTKEGAADLIEAGADAIKVGVGPGAICTTRVIAGVGVPQLTAIADVYEICKAKKIPVIADGGIKSSGDITKAIAAGADVVMIGSLFAGTKEAPGEDIYDNGKRFKSYQGMGSLSAMHRGSGERYFQDSKSEIKKLVPEGIEARVPYRGEIKDVVYQLIGGLRSGMGYCGTKTIAELKDKGKFVKISGAGLKESHPHDVEQTKQSPNYQ